MPETPCKPLHVISPLHKALRQISLYLEEYSRPLGLQPLEGHLLAFLACYGSFTVGQLGRVFGLKGSSLTGLLDRLEGKDLLKRTRNPEDRRSYLIETTAKGRALGLEARKRVQELESEILSRITPADREGFGRVVAAVAQATGVQVHSPASTKE